MLGERPLRALCLFYFLRLGKAEGRANRFRNAGDLLHCRGGHFFAGAAFAQDEPDSRTVNRLVMADCAGELGDFKIGAGQLAVEHGARFIEQVFESLGSEHRIHVARDGRFDFFEIVIRQRLRDHEFNGSGWRSGVVRDFDSHGADILP